MPCARYRAVCLPGRASAPHKPIWMALGTLGPQGPQQVWRFCQRRVRFDRSIVSPTTSIQWRTGTGLTVRRCSRQPMFAVTIACGDPSISADIFRRRSSRGQIGLQQRVRAGRSATERPFASRHDRAAGSLEQRFDAAADALPVLQGARCLPRDARSAATGESGLHEVTRLDEFRQVARRRADAPRPRPHNPGRRPGGARSPSPSARRRSRNSRWLRRRRRAPRSRRPRCVAPVRVRGPCGQGGGQERHSIARRPPARP